MNKKSNLILNDYIHIERRKSRYLLLNTLSGKYAEISVSRKDALLPVLDNLYNDRITTVENGELSELYRSPKKARFLRSCYNELLIEVMPSNEKRSPFLKFSTFKLQNQLIEKNTSANFDGKEVMKSLVDLCLYIGSKDYISPLPKAYLQFVHPISSCQEMSLDTIRKVISQVRDSNVRTLRIAGGDLTRREDLAEIQNLVNDLRADVHYYFSLKELARCDKQKLERIGGSKGCIHVMFSKLDQAFFSKGVDSISKYIPGANYHAIVEDEDFFEFVQAEAGDKEIVYQPLYNGKNQTFFKKHVFNTKTDILGTPISLKEIISNRIINRLLFGKMTILNDGHVYTNLWKKPVGDIGNSSLKDLVYKEYISDRNWFRPRNTVRKCSACIYCDICPPVSNLEYSMNCFSPCKVKLT